MNKLILDIKKLELSIEKTSTKIMSASDFKIYEGDYIQIHGKNGSGKSKFIETLIGRKSIGLSLSSDSVVETEDGSDLLKFDSEQLQSHRTRFRFLSQDDKFEETNDTVFNFIKSNIEQYKHKGVSINPQFVNELLQNYKLIEKDASSKFLFSANSILSKLSGGQVRMVRFVQFLETLENAKLIIVDEPFNNLDLEKCLLVNNLFNQIRIKNPKISMIFVSHYPILTFINKHACIENKYLKFMDTPKKDPFKQDSLGNYDLGIFK